MKYLPWIIGVLYFLCPYDVLPDFLLGTGWLDDLAVLGLAWWWANRLRRYSKAPGGPWPRQEYERKSSAAGNNEEARTYDDEDAHKILGIDKGASEQDIKAAYKRLASQYHPDRVQHLGKEFQELAHKKFVAIQKAYDTLTK